MGRGRAGERVGVAGVDPRRQPFVMPGVATLSQLVATFGARLRAAAAFEADAFDLALVVPIFLGLGVILYFVAPEEPGLAGPATASLAAVAAAWAARGRRWLYIGFVCCAALGVGFSSAKLRTLAVAAPQLTKPLTATMTATVLSVDRRARGGARLVLRPETIAGLAPEAMPALVRLTSTGIDLPAPGDSVTLKALMRPPPPPTVPGGYDFARDAFFHGIGAVGFVAGRIKPAERPVAMTAGERFAAWLDRIRNALTERIVAIVPGEDGAVAASQVTGKRGLIPEDANTALRAAGLYHVVSISGLHMALFAGALFWLIRALLALSQRLALCLPLKALAAMLSLGPAAAYTIFSGAEVATVRSFFMSAIVLMAMALNRTAITRRNVALAAGLVLLTTPEQLLGPSFQMSFGAVAMLVAWYDQPRRPGSRPPTSFAGRVLSRFGVVVVGLMVTTIIASLATAPFSAFHFHRLTVQSLAANFMATPIVSLLIMPLALLALAAEPFGYGAPVWSAMGVAVSWFMAIARMVATWPGSEIVTPQFSSTALAAFSACLVLLAVLRSRLALVAVLPLSLGAALAVASPRPVAILGANGHAALARDGERLAVIADKRDAFNVREWLLAMGDARPPEDPTLAEGRRCDPEGCSVPLGHGRALELDRTMNAIDEDCGKVAILVTPLAAPARCAAAGVVVDRAAILAAGSIAIYEETSSFDAVPRWRVVAARPAGSDRPWAPVAARTIAPRRSAVAPAAATDEAGNEAATEPQ